MRVDLQAIAPSEATERITSAPSDTAETSFFAWFARAVLSAPEGSALPPKGALDKTPPDDATASPAEVSLPHFAAIPSDAQPLLTGSAANESGPVASGPLPHIVASIPPRLPSESRGLRPALSAEPDEKAPSVPAPKEPGPNTAEGVRAEAATRFDAPRAATQVTPPRPSNERETVARPDIVAPSNASVPDRAASTDERRSNERPVEQRAPEQPRDGETRAPLRELRDRGEGAPPVRHAPTGPGLASPLAPPPAEPIHASDTLGRAPATSTTLEWVAPAPSAERSLARIQERVEWLAQRGGGSARIALDPPHLGEVEVRVRTVGDDVQVRLLSALPATQGALELGREWLIDQLAARDFQSIDVEFGSRGDHANDERAALDREARDRDESRRHEPSRTSPAPQESDERDRDADPSAVTTRRIDLRI